MACNDTPIIAALSAAAASVVTAVGLIIAAAATNGSFWKAFLSPPLMIGAGVASGVAAGLIGAGIAAIIVYVNCLRRTHAYNTGQFPTGSILAIQIPCEKEIGPWYTSLTLSAAILAAQSFACFKLAPFTLIPIAPQVAMGIIAATLIAQIAPVIASTAYTATVLQCLNSAFKKP